MFQTFISRHNSTFFTDNQFLTTVTPASSAPVLQTATATSSTLYFDSLTVNAGNGGFLHCIQMDTSVNAANQVVSVGADIAFDAYFFSSGRRHTISYGDWSSDVCSSDLSSKGSATRSCGRANPIPLSASFAARNGHTIPCLPRRRV